MPRKRRGSVNKGSKPKRLRHRVSISRMAVLFGIEKAHLKELQAVCRKHVTTLNKIPAWLLKKTPQRLEHWFNTGK